MRLRMEDWTDQPVADHAEAFALYAKRRDDSGEGASTFADARIVDDGGRDLARISYNGRVWAPGPYDPDAKPLWDNKRTKG